MARPLRIERAGTWYHITVRGNERRDIFRDDSDREHWCELVGEGSGRFGMVVHAYVLMNNHYHLLMETPRANLSQTMQWLNVSYSVWFNRRHRRVGHLFQGRFKAILVEPEVWGLELSRYVHLNPVRLGELGLGKESRRRQRLGVDEKPEPGEVRERVERLRSYRWSSYRAYAGLATEPRWLEVKTVLKGIGKGSLAERRKAYRQHVEIALREGLRASPWEALEAQMVLGAKSFVERICRGVRGDEKEQPVWRRLAGRPRWEEAVAVVEAMKGQKWEQFRDRHRDWGRDLALYLGRKYCGLSLKELGERVGGLDYRSVSWAVDRFAKRAAKEKELRAVLATGQKKIQNPET